MQKNQNIIYKILIGSIIILVIPLLFLINNRENKSKEEPQKQELETKTEIKTESFCYFLSEKNKDGYDTTWLKITQKDKYITGEYERVPFTTDSRKGDFQGYIESEDNFGYKKSIVISNTISEGSEIKEELAINFDNITAELGYGEKINSGDGVYKYYNKDNINFSKKMEYMDCEELEEKLNVENYIRENISKISTLKPVLGGNWYVVSVYVISNANKGEVLYEDGHIQTKASFEYEYSTDPEIIKINNFKNIK